MTFHEYQTRAAQQAPAEAQKQLLLPLILEERDAFIRAEYGRLQSIMGAVYHEGDAAHVFHPLPEPAQGEAPALGNPEELELAELAMLPHLSRRIPRMGTVSYMPLFRAYPSDIYRLNQLAQWYERIMIGQTLDDVQVKILLNGHAEYMQSKQPQEVIVIR